MASYNSHLFLTNEFGIRRGWKRPPPCHPWHVASWLCQWAHVLSAPSCRMTQELKSGRRWAESASLEGTVCFIFSRQSQAFRKRVHMCDHVSFPVTVMIIHSPNLWTLPVGSMILDTEHTMMYKEDSLSITFYNNILDFLKSINV